MTIRKPNKGTALLLLSWLCFVAIPLVNAQHPGSEQQWMRLCTSAGVILIEVDDPDAGALEDHGIHCPCVQNLFISNSPRMPAPTYGRSILNVDIALDNSPVQPFSAYSPRAPPVA
ncbi:MAG: hypothetical protein LAT65_08560 [Saccharospirillum sp.]|nr:hypothetical protein [Saccharospirillum sp.]